MLTAISYFYKRTPVATEIDETVISVDEISNVEVVVARPTNDVVQVIDDSIPINTIIEIELPPMHWIERERLRNAEQKSQYGSSACMAASFSAVFWIISIVMFTLTVVDKDNYSIFYEHCDYTMCTFNSSCILHNATIPLYGKCWCRTDANPDLKSYQYVCKNYTNHEYTTVGLVGFTAALIGGLMMLLVMVAAYEYEQRFGSKLCCKCPC